MKNPPTPAGIEPATFWFVAQHLNHCAAAVPELGNSVNKHETCVKTKLQQILNQQSSSS